MSNHRLRRFVAKWDVPFAVATVVLYGAAIPVLVVAFPNVSNLTISILVLLSGFTASLSALAALLKEREPNERP